MTRVYTGKGRESGTWGRHTLLAVMRLGFVGGELCGSETAIGGSI